MGQEKSKTLLFVISLLLITIMLFAITVQIRKPWLGKLSRGNQQWLTGTTLIFTKNWYREGALKLRFATLEQPESIETATALQRTPWVSYPAGGVMPIFFISKIRGYEPTPSLVMKYNLMNHFFIAFFLSLIIFFFLSLQLKFSQLNSFLFAIIPIFLELFLPGPFYWHQNVFFFPQAVILPFVLVVFLEVLRLSAQKKSTINLLQGVVIFYGFLTAWIFVFVGLILYLSRIARAEIPLNKLSEFLKKSAKFWLAPVAALSLFAFQLYVRDAFSKIWSRFIFRTALAEEGQKYTVDFANKFWGNYIAQAFGAPATKIIWICLLIFLALGLYIIFQGLKKKKINKDIVQTTLLIGLLLLPCFLIVYFVKNSSAIHKWTALKFSIPFTTIPFVLIPAVLLTFLGKNPKKRLLTTLTALTMIILSGIYAINVYSNYLILFPTKNPEFEQKMEAAQFISENTSYRDIVFSPDYKIDPYPPALLSTSMKRVYKIKAISQIQELVKNVEEDYTVNFFVLDNETEVSPRLRDLLPLAFDEIKKDNFRIYRINREDIPIQKT